MSNGNWDQFGSLNKLDFVFHGMDERDLLTLYANSRHMLQIIVSVEIFDKTEEKKLNVTDDEIRNAIYFCYADTGNTLGSPWTISDYPGEYLTNGDDHGTNESFDTDSSIRYIYKYISCDPHNFNELQEIISIGIDVPGIGKFNTTHNGTKTKGHTFKQPKVYKIIAEPPIDFEDHNNLTIQCGAFETLSNNLKCEYWETRNEIKTRMDGECKRRIVSIKPNYKNKTTIGKFKKHEIVYTPILNDALASETQWCGNDYYDKCFSVLEVSDGLPGSVIGRDYKDDYQLNLWFSRQNNLNLLGSFYVADKKYFYKFHTEASHKHAGEDEKGAATLLLYKFKLPIGSTYKWKWQNVFRGIEVNVTDFYGNEGTFKIAFDDDKQFDEPGLV